MVDNKYSQDPDSDEEWHKMVERINEVGARPDKTDAYMEELLIWKRDQLDVLAADTSGIEFLEKLRAMPYEPRQIGDAPSSTATSGRKSRKVDSSSPDNSSESAQRSTGSHPDTEPTTLSSSSTTTPRSLPDISSESAQRSTGSHPDTEPTTLSPPSTTTPRPSLTASSPRRLSPSQAQTQEPHLHGSSQAPVFMPLRSTKPSEDTLTLTVGIEHGSGILRLATPGVVLQETWDWLVERVDSYLSTHADPKSSKNRHHNAWLRRVLDASLDIKNDVCYGSKVIGSASTTSWQVGHEGLRACRKCQEAKRPCLFMRLNGLGEVYLVVLPVVQNNLSSPDWNSRGSWIDQG